MKTAVFAKLARRVALGVAIGACALSLSLTLPSSVNADAVDDARTAIAQYKRGNIADSVEKFETVMNGGLDDDSRRRIRDEVGLDLAREFAANSLPDAGLKRRLSGIGLWLLTARDSDESSGAPYFGRISDDPDGVKRFVDEYMSESNMTLRVQRAQQIRDKYGEFAVPYIHTAYMRDDSADVRSRAAALLGVIGAQATMPLIQIMHSGVAEDREYAARALGEIRDARALPVLKQFYRASGESPAVVQACLSAMQNILGGDGPATADAQTMWYVQAEAYYRNEAVGGYAPGFAKLIGSGFGGNLPNVVDVPNRAYAVWRWADANNDGNGGLHHEMVPAWAYADTLAEECVMQAYKLGVANAGMRGYSNADEDPFVRDAQSLLARVSVHQYIAGRTRLATGSDEEKEFISRLLGEAGVERFQHLRGYASMMGSKTLLHAIQQSYNDGYPMVTVGLINALLEMDDMPSSNTASAVEWEVVDASAESSGTEGGGSVAPANDNSDMYAPLVEGLANPDRRIRYAAARALVVAGRNADYGANGMALNELSNSLAESSTRTIMVIAEDPQLRRKFATELENFGYSVLQFDDLQTGIMTATQSPIVDGIILEAEIAGTPVFKWAPSASELENAEAREADLPMRILTSDVRTSAIPLFVAGPQENKDSYMERFAAYMSGETFTAESVIGYGENVSIGGDELNAAIQTAFTRNVELEMFAHNTFVRETAMHIAKSIDANDSMHNVNGLLKALGASMQTVEGRTDDTRAAIAMAIGKLSNYTGLDYAVGNNLVSQLTSALQGDQSLDTPAVKAAAAAALGRLFKSHKGLYMSGSETFTALKATMRLQYDFTAITEDNDVFRNKIRGDVLNAREQAGLALGQAPLSAAEKLDVAETERASRHIPLEAQGKASAESEE